jgi:hypothetical protein
MQDSAVVAAVVAGEADGFAAAYDQYAASLYGYCHGVLPGPEAAEAVLDTWHPGVVAAAAVVATLAVTAGITVVMTAGGSHRPQASGAGLGGGVPAPASSTPTGATSRPPSPARTAPASAHPTSPAAPAGATSARPSPGRGTPAPTASPSGPSPSASSSPAQGYLLVAPDKLMLTSKSGKPASGFFVLTAANGPVAHYTVRVAALAGRVRVAPAGGSFPVNGYVEVTVTVTSKVALTTHVVVEPGNLTVTVVYKPKPPPPPPSPSPPPSPKPSPPPRA